MRVLTPLDASSDFFPAQRTMWQANKISRVEKTDPVQFKGGLKQGPFVCKNRGFASGCSPLRYKTFIPENCLKKRQICLSKVPCKNHDKPNRVSFSTSENRRYGLLRHGNPKDVHQQAA